MALLRVGFAKPTCHHAAGALLPHLFTRIHAAFRLTVRRGRCIFCGTFREVTLPGRYPAPYPAESGLSSHPDLAEVETGGHPTAFGHYHRNAHRNDLQPKNSDGPTNPSIIPSLPAPEGRAAITMHTGEIAWLRSQRQLLALLSDLTATLTMIASTDKHPQ